MGNLKIDKINDISMSTGYLRNYGQITGGDFIAQCCEKAGQYRMFNTTSTYPPDAKIVSEGGSDYFVDTFLAENNTWVRLEARNVRNENIWERQCRNGQWFDWVLLPNNVQIKSKMDLKVDKVEGYALSKNDFNDAYKTKVDGMTNHFKGVFNTVVEINALTGCIKGDYVILKGSPDLLYYHNGTAFINSGASLGGDMLSTIYDSGGKKANIYNRANHDGAQAISTIVDLQAELDKKVPIVNQIKVIDNTNSSSVVDALSARVGNELKGNFLDIISGLRPIAFKGVFEEKGHITLGDKLIIQWNNQDMGVGYDNKTLEVPFNVPFPNKCFVVIACPIASNTTNSGCDSASASIIDNTKFYLCKDYATTCWSTACSWIAIGF